MASSVPIAPASTMPVLTMSIYTQKTIQLYPSLLASITSLLNAAFRDNFAKLTLAPRYESPDAFAHQLGPYGLCAVLLDESADTGNLPQVAATAAIIPWHGDPFEPNRNASRPTVKGDGSTIWDWKLGPVASQEGIRYRGKGLVVRCVDELEAILRDRMVKNMGMEAMQQEITMWIQVYERVNGAYWRRRGFVEVYKSEMASGIWNSEDPFTMTTYKRVVDMNLDLGSKKGLSSA